MKTTISITCFIFLFTGIICIAPANSQPVVSHGQLHVDGPKLKDQNGDVVVLRGMSYGWHNWWPRFYNQGTVKWLHRDWGCTVIRAAMGIEPPKGYLQKPKWSKKKIKTLVKAAIRENIYIIIDWHSHNMHLEEAKAFFKEMAETYGHYPHVIYEIFNEPDHETWDEVKAYTGELISVIRDIDPDNIILIGSPQWDQKIDIVADDPVTGYNNIMYTLHFYAATHKQWLRDRCEYAITKGLPIFVSESAGMEANGDGDIDHDEWNKWIACLDKHQISWIAWAISDKEETCSVLKRSAGSKGKWKDRDLKEWGIQVRSLLRKY